MANPVMLIDGVAAATRQAISRLLQGRYTLVIVARSSGLFSSLAQKLNDAYVCICDISDREKWGATKANKSLLPDL